MAFTIEDVGTRKRGGKSVKIPDEEKRAIVDEWNANETAERAEEAKETREGLIRERMHSIAHSEAERQLIEAGTIT